MQQFQGILHKPNLIDHIQDGSFRGCSPKGKSQKDLIPKSSHTYLTMMKLITVIPYLKRSKKFMNHVTYHRSSAVHFFTRNQQILLYQKIQIYISFWYIISNSFNFFDKIKFFFDKHAYNFDDVSKNGSSSLS